MIYNTINISIINDNPYIEYMNYQSISILFMSCFIYSLCRILEDNFNKIKKFINFVIKYNFLIYLFHGFTIGLLLVVYVLTFIFTYPIILIKKKITT